MKATGVLIAIVNMLSKIKKFKSSCCSCDCKTKQDGGGGDPVELRSPRQSVSDTSSSE